MLPEEKARIEIDRQLIELGYTVQDLSELDLTSRNSKMCLLLTSRTSFQSNGAKKNTSGRP